MEREFEWIRIADNRDALAFTEDNIAEAHSGEKMICIGRYNNELFAFAHKCPHGGAPLMRGYLDMQGNVVCPLHRYKFNIQNGRNVTGEGYTLRHWRVEERVDGIFVAMDKLL